MQKLTATESPSVPTVVPEKAYQQRTAYPFSTRRKKTLLTTAKHLFFHFDDPCLFEQFTKYPLWLVENHVAPDVAHITPASICIVLIVQKVIATV